MIALSNGVTLKYVAASGALWYDGLGWPWEWPLRWFGFLKPELFVTITKTLTRHPREGNLRWWKPFECVKFIPGGSVNKVGLTNPGIEWWCKRIAPNLNMWRIPLAVSIHGNEQELVEMAKMVDRFRLVAVEVNYSCPNTGHAMANANELVSSIKAVAQVSRHPIIAKLSVAQVYCVIAERLQGIAQAVTLNTVPWELAFPGERSPLSRLEERVGSGGGGVSGIPAQPLNWKAVEEIAKFAPRLPVIAPGIMTLEDIDKTEKLGAKAWSFGACFLRTPWRPTRIVMENERRTRARADNSGAG
jgi:dihydroorotate dehydrogenase